MRNLIVTLFMLMPVLVFAQSKSEYEQMMGKFMKFYNNSQPDSICSLYSDVWGEKKATLWSTDMNKALRKKYGKMISYTYIGAEPEDGVILFKTKFTKSIHATGIMLEKDKKIGTFRFKTSSDYIDSILKKY